MKQEQKFEVNWSILLFVSKIQNTTLHHTMVKYNFSVYLLLSLLPEHIVNRLKSYNFTEIVLCYKRSNIFLKSWVGV